MPNHEFPVSFGLFSVIAAFVESLQSHPSQGQKDKVGVEVHSAKAPGVGPAAGGGGGGGDGGGLSDDYDGGPSRSSRSSSSAPAALGLLLPGGAGSVLLEGPTARTSHGGAGSFGGGLGGGVGGGVSGGGVFRLFKDEGFTEVDLQAVVSAYTAALDSAKEHFANTSNKDSKDSKGGGGGSGGSSSSDFSDDRQARTFFGDDLADLLKEARRHHHHHPTFPPGEGGEAKVGPGGGGGDKGGGGAGGAGFAERGRGVQGGAGDAMGKEEALASLEKLGLVVYEPKDQDGVDWESMAG